MYVNELSAYNSQISLVLSLVSDYYSKYILLSRIAIFEGFLTEKVIAAGQIPKKTLEPKINAFKNIYGGLGNDISGLIFEILYKLIKLRNDIAHGNFEVRTNKAFYLQIEYFLEQTEISFNCLPQRSNTEQIATEQPEYPLDPTRLTEIRDAIITVSLNS
jgi:hypothetical protein